MPVLWTLILFMLTSCLSSKDSTAKALRSYQAEQAQSSGQLVNGTSQDRWESPLYIMLNRNKPLSNDQIRELCQRPARLQAVPLEAGQTLSPETDFKVHREGRSCYDKQLGGTCNGYNYHGTFTCYYYLNKAAP